MREIGLHLRLAGSLQELIQKALALNIPFFQCFFVDSTTGRIIKPAEHDVQEFIRLRRQHFPTTYLHGSYWINLAGVEYTLHRSLYRELELAKKLEFTHIILHPGAATGAQEKNQETSHLVGWYLTFACFGGLGLRRLPELP